MLIEKSNFGSVAALISAKANGKRVVIFDLDGTLTTPVYRTAPAKGADSSEWDAFYLKCDTDQPKYEIIRLLRSYYEQGFKVILLTGRSDICMQATYVWLDRWDVPFHELHMRARNNWSPAVRFKQEWLLQNFMNPGLEGAGMIEILVDDHPGIIEMAINFQIPVQRVNSALS